LKFLVMIGLKRHELKRRAAGAASTALIPGEPFCGGSSRRTAIFHAAGGEILEVGAFGGRCFCRHWTEFDFLPQNPGVLRAVESPRARNRRAFWPNREAKVDGFCRRLRHKGRTTD
jgi:hypothetical protein